MKKIVCVAIILAIALSIIGCSGSESSKEKSKFEVMADVLNAIANAGMDESEYNQRSMARAVVVDDELSDTFGPNTFVIAPGFNVTISGSIIWKEIEVIITFDADSTLTNYSSDGYILNGNLDETVNFTIAKNGQEITEIKQEFFIEGTIIFGGKESGSFAFNDLTINFVVDPQTGKITSKNVTGTVTFNGQNVTNELIAELQAISI